MPIFRKADRSRRQGAERRRFGSGEPAFRNSDPTQAHATAASETGDQDLQRSEVTPMHTLRRPDVVGRLTSVFNVARSLLEIQFYCPDTTSPTPHSHPAHGHTRTSPRVLSKGTNDRDAGERGWELDHCFIYTHVPKLFDDLRGAGTAS